MDTQERRICYQSYDGHRKIQENPCQDEEKLSYVVNSLWESNVKDHGGLLGFSSSGTDLPKGFWQERLMHVSMDDGFLFFCFNASMIRRYLSSPL